MAIEKTAERDFARDRLAPFLIGFCVNIGFSVVCGILYFLTAFIFAIGAFSISGGSGLGAIPAFIAAAPLVLCIFLLGIAFWLLNTWLLGKWSQEKYRDYMCERRARAERREEKQNHGQEADWEAEWNMMKRQEKENFLNKKRAQNPSGGKASASPNQDNGQNSTAPEDRR